MKVKDLIHKLLELPLNAEVLLLHPEGAESWSTHHVKGKRVILGSGTYGNENPRVARLRIPKPPRKALP